MRGADEEAYLRGGRAASINIHTKNWLRDESDVCVIVYV